MEVLGDENIENLAQIWNSRPVQILLIIVKRMPDAGEGGGDPVKYAYVWILWRHKLENSMQKLDLSLKVTLGKLQICTRIGNKLLSDSTVL